MSQSAMPSLVHRAEAHAGEGLDTPGCVDLLSFLSMVTDPRQRRGVRHGMASLLTVAAAAVVAGARSFAAIGEWVTDASQEVLAALGIRRNARVGRHVPPDEATLRRALQKVDPDEADRLFSAFLAARRPAPVAAAGPPGAVALDGKTVRGARDHADPASRAPHLVSVVTHERGSCWPNNRSTTSPTRSVLCSRC